MKSISRSAAQWCTSSTSSSLGISGPSVPIGCLSASSKMKTNMMSSLTSANSTSVPTTECEFLTCDTAGLTGRSTSERSERLALVEALATEPDRLFCKQVCHNIDDVQARIMELDASMLRMERMTERLRQLLPEGVRIGDYLQIKSNGKRERPRPARRIY